MNKKSIYTPISVYPTLLYYLSRIRLILISVLIVSCHGKENKEEVSKNKFQWEPGISAPIYYPVAGNIDFGNAGNGSNTSFANGWGNQYGHVVGERYKDIPKQVYIDYYSVVDSKSFRGTILLPQQKIKNLFEKYDIKDNFGYLVVGMAPGGWIRVWFQTTDEKADELVSIEVAKAELKGYKNETVGIGLKTKDFKTWGSTYTYWQHHGIPYEAWAENEKEYDIIFDFNKPNPKNEAEVIYISADGTFYQNGGEKVHQKLPVQLEQLSWLGKSGSVYNCKVPLPKNFKKYVEQKKLKEVKLQLEIENDDEHATIYLITNNTKEKIVRFKNKQPTEKEKKDINYAYATEIEYFIQ